MRVSCPDHPGKALKPEVGDDYLLFECGGHFAYWMQRPPKKEKSKPEKSA